MTSTRFKGFFVACLLGVCAYTGAAGTAHAEEIINSFASDITLAEDGTFAVTETIEYTFDAPRHGIFREIPLVHPEAPSSVLKQRLIEINLTSVRVDGEEVSYVDESGDGLFKVRIGDASGTIEGTHTYEIKYTVGGGLWYPENEAPELYFNVTGSGWDVPILSAEATVRSGTSVFRTEHSCYTGAAGMQGSCAITVDTNGAVHFHTIAPLDPGEGLTIAQAVEYGTVATDIRERIRWGLIAIPFVLLCALYGAWRVYRYKTAFKTGAPIIAEYEPYPEVKPMYAGLLMDKQLDPRDVTAGIVYLAREGYIKIRHTEKKVLFFFEVDDYEITLQKPIADLGGAFEETLLVMLFGSTDTAVGTTRTLSDLKHDLSEQKENYERLTALKSALHEDLKTRGFMSGFEFSKIFNRRTLFGFVGVMIVLALISDTAVILLIAAAVILFAVIADGRRTRKGYEALDHLLGFKEFLSVTDTERFAFHNAPQKSPEQFMEYLPYAIAFGVEKEWAEAFKGITIPNPDWYDGSTTARAFVATDFTHSIGAFSTALASSGTSGSTGGGSSGGGSGGGGGGSW